MNPTKCRSSSGSRMRAKTGCIEAASRAFFSIGTYEAVEPLNDARVIQSEALRMNKLPQRSNAEIRGSAFDWHPHWPVRVGRNDVTAFHPMSNEGMLWACTSDLFWREGGGQRLNSPLLHKIISRITNVLKITFRNFLHLLHGLWLTKRHLNVIHWDIKRNESQKLSFPLRTPVFRTRPLSSVTASWHNAVLLLLSK